MRPRGILWHCGRAFRHRGNVGVGAPSAGNEVGKDAQDPAAAPMIEPASPGFRALGMAKKPEATEGSCGAVTDYPSDPEAAAGDL